MPEVQVVITPSGNVTRGDYVAQIVQGLLIAGVLSSAGLAYIAAKERAVPPGAQGPAPVTLVPTPGGRYIAVPAR
ncbi:MAG: hypothetical protein ACUVRO_09865 [Armatimonadota bacterium]